jgi:hypothetical protein
MLVSSGGGTGGLWNREFVQVWKMDVHVGFYLFLFVPVKVQVQGFMFRLGKTLRLWTNCSDKTNK